MEIDAQMVLDSTFRFDINKIERVSSFLHDLLISKSSQFLIIALPAPEKLINTYTYMN